MFIKRIISNGGAQQGLRYCFRLYIHHNEIMRFYSSTSCHLSPVPSLPENYISKEVFKTTFKNKKLCAEVEVRLFVIGYRWNWTSINDTFGQYRTRFENDVCNILAYVNILFFYNTRCWRYSRRL